ncbi:hypothetical protein BAUCODRAFT_125304 [Baudoinia panamericana UAMH 10762]|uniref:J domain-containing protein n=1 Tax=Baudoinia panamericana (strain UAMH 10762) TaxID=717646 RepID=M2N394_BAUPA|nr:uncharacterized protein BAUCODRAFT_125304 [Baudoinia panamericana UAMH 10762]EMC93449.1 hypothetical protein BAUCODRAFT_125304 [Baudoinia panamericana UAMH 10762]
MKRGIVQSVPSVLHPTRLLTLNVPQSIPFVCAACRQAAAGRRRAPDPIKLRRSFASSIHRGEDTNPQHPQRETVTPQTHYDFFPQTFPSGPPPRTPFTPDLKQLRKEFLQLQSKAHPDLAPAEQKRQAEALSSRINEAYKTLQDPLKRAQYLLALQGIDVEDESAKLSENALLMEVMEAREAVDEVESEEELVSLRQENDVRIAESVERLDNLFGSGDLDNAAQEAIRLRYWKNIEESIHGWEKGRGGGLLHH